MTTLQIEEPIASKVAISEEELSVHLCDGRSINIPLSWYPRIFHGSPSERKNFVIEGGGHGIHWPELDEDISIEGMIAGRPSQESAKSLKRWLDKRKA
jgi:hypothetical protein